MSTDQKNSMAWPDFMSALEPEESESALAAVAPTDLAVRKPSTDLPASVAVWAGEWSGWAGQGRSFDVKLIVENLALHEATIVCARASDVQGAFFASVPSLRFTGTNCKPG